MPVVGTKIKKLGEKLDLPEIFGEAEGDVLVVGWGSTWGPIREAIMLAQEEGKSYSAFHLRYVNPMPNGIETVFARFKHVIVVELNDEGLYGSGQLATLLRSRYCDPKIQSICKTDGLTFGVRDILNRVEAAITS